MSGGNAAHVLKVWWIPQVPMNVFETPVPMNAFETPVPDIKTGALLCDALARYDLFQYDNSIKPDYSNAGGVSFLNDDGEWSNIDLDDPDEVAYAESVLTARTQSDTSESAS